QKFFELTQDESRPNGMGRSPCVGLVGDYVLVTDRKPLLERAIVTQSDASKSLASELDFKVIASKIGRLTSGVKPGLITFNRPEEGLRFLYDLANSDQVRNGLRNQAENNDFFRNLNGALEKNPLPP